MASTVLSRTQTSGSLRKFTLSAWNKRSGLSSYQGILNAYSSDSDRNAIFWQTTDEIAIYFKTSGSSHIFLQTNAKFRDTAAWYHVVVSVDTTQATESDRVKLYVNGDQITSFSTETYPSQNSDFSCIGRNTQSMKVGILEYGAGPSTGYFDGSMAHYHFIDGTAYAASTFGETDSTTGIWKAKTSPSVTYGTNGFFLKFDNSGSLGTDSSGQSNNLSISGTLSQTLDTPTNNFATLNPLKRLGTTSVSFEQGNLRFHTTTTSWGNTNSSLAFTKGKWYAEVKIMNLVSTTGYGSVGISDINLSDYNGNDTVIKQDAETAGVALDHRSGSSDIRSGTSVVTSNIGDFSNNDILGLAVDMDNKALYIHKNGTYYQISGVTGVPTSGASKTGAITIPASVVDCAFHAGSYTSDADIGYNFGSPFFSISSGNSDANGYGNFEYAVPSGYYALNTKNLAEYG